MRLYYGAPARYDRVLTADQVGHGRPGEENRPDFRDVVFLTTDWAQARSYGEFVYTVATPAAVPYAQEYSRRASAGLLNRQKSRKNREKKIKTLQRQTTIYVAPPESIVIKSCTRYPGTAKP